MTNTIPKKSLGQHFLIDKNIARKIVDLINISSEDVIIEIGPGQGILTQFFLDKSADFIAIEKDLRYVQILQEQFRGNDKLRIVHQDFLSFEFRSLETKNRRVKCVGNLPYYITSSVLFTILSVFPLIEKGIFMMQKEVAQRIVSSHGNKNYGILSVLLQSFYRISRQFSVSKTVFRPIPKVDSAVISLEIRPDFDLNCDMLYYQKLVKTAFNQRRKLLSNSLQGLISKNAMQHLNFDFNRRAEQVNVNEWINLCRILTQKKNQFRPRNG